MQYFILFFSIFLIACQVGETPTGDVVRDSNRNPDIGNDDSSLSSSEIARQFMINTQIYSYDGSNLRLIDSEEGSVDTYTFAFESENTGYGDRWSKETLALSVDHQTVIKVDDRIVVSAVTDGYWNEITNRPISRNAVTMRYNVKQCESEDTPWQLWYTYEDAVGEPRGEKPSDIVLIEQFYEQFAGTSITDVRKVIRQEATCNACNVCLEDYYYTLSVDTGYSAQQLEEDGWAYDQPFSKEKAEQAVKNWIIKSPTFKDNGRNLELVTSYVDQQNPQKIVITYGYDSIKEGYGSDYVTIGEGKRYHDITVTVNNGIVTSAIIDGRWDELRQRPV